MNSIKSLLPWRRMIGSISIPSLYACIEQLDHPELIGHELLVVNATGKKIVLDCSDSARMKGLLPGIELNEALKQVPSLKYVYARPNRYQELIEEITLCISDICPETEIFSIDRYYLDLSSYQAYYKNQPLRIVNVLKDSIKKHTGLTPFIGLASNKSCADWAAKNHLIIEPDATINTLNNIPLGDFFPLGELSLSFCNRHNIKTLGDIQKLPSSLFLRELGSFGQYLWLFANGQDTRSVELPIQDDALFSQQKSIPLYNNSFSVVGEFMKISDLFYEQVKTEKKPLTHLEVAIKTAEGWRKDLLEIQGTLDSSAIFLTCKKFLKKWWFHENVYEINLRGFRRTSTVKQSELFKSTNKRRSY